MRDDLLGAAQEEGPEYTRQSLPASVLDVLDMYSRQSGESFDHVVNDHHKPIVITKLDSLDSVENIGESLTRQET
jgi:hypothetical protein